MQGIDRSEGQGARCRRSRAQPHPAGIERLANPLRDAFRAMGRGTAKAFDEVLRPPLAGYHSGEEYTVAVDEFVPRTIRTKVNEPVRWTMVGAHTISFDVPEYVPVFNVGKAGLVRRDSRTDEPAGGSPPIPEVDFTSGTPPAIDAGTWTARAYSRPGSRRDLTPPTSFASRRQALDYRALIHQRGGRWSSCLIPMRDIGG